MKKGSSGLPLVSALNLAAKRRKERSCWAKVYFNVVRKGRQEKPQRVRSQAVLPAPTVPQSFLLPWEVRREVKSPPGREVTAWSAFYCHLNSFSRAFCLPLPMNTLHLSDLLLDWDLSARRGLGKRWPAEAVQGKVDQDTHSVALSLAQPSGRRQRVLTLTVVSIVIQGSQFCKEVHTSQSFSCEYFWSHGATLFYENSFSKYLYAGCNVTLGLGRGWDEQSPVALAICTGWWGDRAWEFSSASAPVPEQTSASRRQKESHAVNRWVRVAVCHGRKGFVKCSLSLTCCIIIQALLQLLKEFSSWSKMPALPGQALTFMAPDGTENGWFWIQPIETTDRNTVLCCSQLFPWTGKGMYWMRCSVVICYLNMPSQICICNKSHGKVYETKLSTASMNVPLLLEIIKEERITCFLLPINTSISGQIFSLALTKT